MDHVDKVLFHNLSHFLVIEKLGSVPFVPFIQNERNEKKPDAQIQ